MKLKEAGCDPLPVIMIIVVFQLAVLRQQFPELLEVLMVVAGLMLLVRGLETGLFPMGEVADVPSPKQLMQQHQSGMRTRRRETAPKRGQMAREKEHYISGHLWQILPLVGLH